MKYISKIIDKFNTILTNEQHGFFPCRCTVTCNLTFCNYVFYAFSEGSQVHVIYTDFAKAFNSVNHKILFSVLDASGFGDPILSWFKSFLTDRSQWVKFFNIKPNVFIPTSSVPQSIPLTFFYFF